MLDIIMSPSVASVYEGFADLTLVFGFLQKPISVIGVGWFLGLVFVFYLIFPFFCVLIENKKRAWTAFAVSLMYNFVCANYFEVGRSNILYDACFFLAGGLIYLYHMVIFRIVEKLKLNQILGNGWLRYVVTSVLVIAGATVFAVVMQKIICRAMEIMNKRKLIG